MEKIAYINGGTFIYWSSIVLTIAVIAAIDRKSTRLNSSH